MSSYVERINICIELESMNEASILADLIYEQLQSYRDYECDRVVMSGAHLIYKDEDSTPPVPAIDITIYPDAYIVPLIIFEGTIEKKEKNKMYFDEGLVSCESYESPRRAICIECESEDDTQKIGKNIYDQLKTNEDYKEGSIQLVIDREKKQIFMNITAEVENIPTIII